MTGKTHAVIGGASALALTTIASKHGWIDFGSIEIVANCVAGVVGGLACDIDINGSKANNKIDKGLKEIRKYVTIGITVFVLIGMMAAVTKGFSWKTALVLGGVGEIIAILLTTVITSNPAKYLKHRGITHTLVFPVAIWLFYESYSSVWLIGAVILGFLTGYVLHIIADLFNYKGVPVFWPLTNKHFHVMSIKTGGKFEGLFLLIALGGLGLLCYVA